MEGTAVCKPSPLASSGHKLCVIFSSHHQPLSSLYEYCPAALGHRITRFEAPGNIAAPDHDPESIRSLPHLTAAGDERVAKVLHCHNTGDP